MKVVPLFSFAICICVFGSSISLLAQSSHSQRKATSDPFGRSSDSQAVDRTFGPFDSETEIRTRDMSGSTAISVPTHSVRQRTTIARSSDLVPNSMPPNWRNWESLMAQSYPDQFNGEQSAEKLVEQLQAIGLPIVLNRSARDDMLGPSDSIELGLRNQSLGTRLQQALSDHNACITFGQNQIEIISQDEQEDLEFFMTISYDVTGMGLNPERMIRTIADSISSDSWMDYGTGLGTINEIRVRGRDLLVISQSYRNQLAIRELLDGMVRLTGNRRVRNQSVPSSSNQGANPLVSSMPVVVPQIPQRRMFPTPTQNGTQQPGPYGGVFRIEN